MVVQSTAWISQILHKEKPQVLKTLASGRVWPIKAALFWFSEKAIKMPSEKDLSSGQEFFPCMTDMLLICRWCLLPAPAPPTPHLQHYHLFIFTRRTPCVQCAFSVHSDQKPKALKMGEHSRMGQVAPSYARYSRILTCRNSIFNHIKHEKNPRMKNPRLSTQIIFVSWQLQYDDTPELHRFFSPYFRRWCGERQERGSQN